ncbi:MAG TPA: hypothetical protein VFC63_20780, partial [Blastocatellia bacterium]|nr:hypothetical protein [Blastocatellia bacterium]
EDSQPPFRQLKRRPLNLPVVHKGERCPVTKGDQTHVPHAGYIFCSSCFWFGNGPVFFALSWSPQDSDEARFALTKVPYEEHAYRAKTPWVSSPDYEGPILIRGRRLDGSGGGKLRFSYNGLNLTDEMELTATRDQADPSRWSFWPTSMYVPSAGCYGVQIDTNNGTDLIVFEATEPK